MTSHTEDIAREIVQLVREASDLDQVFVGDEHFVYSHVEATAKIAAALVAYGDEVREAGRQEEREATMQWLAHQSEAALDAAEKTAGKGRAFDQTLARSSAMIEVAAWLRSRKARP